MQLMLRFPYGSQAISVLAVCIFIQKLVIFGPKLIFS